MAVTREIGIRSAAQICRGPRAPLGEGRDIEYGQHDHVVDVRAGEETHARRGLVRMASGS